MSAMAGYCVLHAREQFAVGYLAPEVSPEHLGAVQPRAVGRQVKQHEPARCPRTTSSISSLVEPSPPSLNVCWDVRP